MLGRLYDKISLLIEQMMKDKSKYILAPFGSFATGFMLKGKSDLDIALIIEDPKVASNPNKIYYSLNK